MEEDIQNYSSIVMFRGTPCILRLQITSFILYNVHEYKYESTFLYKQTIFL